VITVNWTSVFIGSLCRMLLAGCLSTLAANAFAFDGKIDVVMTRGGESTALLYR
jgi:hypothetical protein